uniref:SH2 domain-containing protein n=1 Tax=Plectus sambesii TaxID=2011161 RepID=A0A914WYY0_9BILA
MYSKTNTARLDLSFFDIEHLKGLKDNIKAAPKEYKAFLKTVPDLIENLGQAHQFLEDHLKEVLSSFCLPSTPWDMLDASQTQDTEQLTALCTKHNFHHLYCSINHVINYGEKLKTLLRLGQHIQPCDDNQLNTLEETVLPVKKLQTTLLEHLLRITKQPPPVINVGDSFETEVCLLANISPVAPALRIRIIKAADAEKLVSGAATCEEIESSATIAENRAALLEYGQIWISHFKKKPLLKKISHSWNVDGEHLNKSDNQKCVLLYEIVPNFEKSQNSASLERIWTLSHPFLIINDLTQYSDAFATILWDRIFDGKDTEWCKLSTVLSKVFSYLTGATKRSLSESDLLYFRRKLGISSDSGTVSLKRFSKEDVDSDLRFSFWSWFCSICKIIRANLLPYWEKGYLMGFDTKESIAQKMLYVKKCCFLLRFSDSQLGALSISRFDFDSSREHRHTAFLLPPDQELHSLTKQLENFDRLKDIDYICDKNFTLINKKLFLDSPDLIIERSNQSELNADNKEAYSIYIQCMNGLWNFLPKPFSS